MDVRHEWFWNAVLFDSETQRHFNRTDISSGRPFEIDSKKLLHCVLKFGSLRQQILLHELVYYNGFLYTADAFNLEDSVSLKEEAQARPERYCVSIKQVAYSGTEQYNDAEPLFDLSTHYTDSYRDYIYNDGYNLNYQYAHTCDDGPPSSGDHGHIHGHHEELPKEKTWKSSVFFAPESTNKQPTIDKNTFEKYANDIRDIPDNFGDALRYFMEKRSITQEELAFNAGISERNLRRFLSNEDTQPKLETVIAICIALHLFPVFSNCLIAKAGYSLRNNDKGIAYQILLNVFYTEDIETCNRLLKEMGLSSLTNNEI